MKFKLIQSKLLILIFIKSIAIGKEVVASSFSFENSAIEIITEDIKPGEGFKIKVSKANQMNEKAWVGIFKPNLNQKDPSGYFSYVYVGGKTNEIEMTAPPQKGDFELRLYDNDPGDFVSATKLKVVGVLPSQYSITLLTKEVKPSQEFKVNITSSYNIDSRAWLGIFKSDADKSSPKEYLSYLYIPSSSGGGLTLTAPVEPGNYELRFYSADPGELINQIPFRIGKPDLPGITFSLNHKEYGPGEEISVDYVGHENLAESAWIGLFKGEDVGKGYNKYLDYFYLRPKLKGKFSFKAPTTKGTYHARMFYAETGPELLKPISFEVSSSLDKESIKETLTKEGKITLYGIYFDTNKSIVKLASYPLINEIAKMLNSNPSLKISIEGHTDSEGNDEYNQSLSQKRAEAVLRLLTDKYGVKKEQLQFKGFGETQPVGDNSTVAGRAKNRRVELKKL